MKTIVAVLVALAATAAAQLLTENIVSVYRAPVPITFSRDSSLVSEKAATIGSVYDKPFFAAIKVEGKNEIEAYLMKDGMSTLNTGNPLAGYVRAVREELVSGPNRVGIMLSAARYLGLPEMDMPIVKMAVPTNFTLSGVYRLSTENALLPWMYLANRKDLTPGTLDKLIEVGQFAVSQNKVHIARDN